MIIKSIVTALGIISLASIQAATIEWSVYDITDDVSNISTNGTLVDARNGSEQMEVTVNGVTFKNRENSGDLFESLFNNDIIRERGWGKASTVSDQNYRRFLTYGQRSGVLGEHKSPRSSPAAEWTTVTIAGLTVGNRYEIQIFASCADMKANTAQNEGLLLGDGSTGSPALDKDTLLYCEMTEDGTGQYGIGTFVADAMTQAFNVRKVTNLDSSAILGKEKHFSNGWQLRDLGPAQSNNISSHREPTTSTAGETILLGGFDGTNKLDAPKQSAGLSGLEVELTTNAPDTNQTGQMKSTLWGSTELDPDAFTTGMREDRAVVRGGIVTPWRFSLTITNNTGSDVNLNQIHYITQKDSADGPSLQTLTYTSGSLSDSYGRNTGTFAIENGSNKPVDVDLSGFLSDLTLAGNGETAVFTWSHGSAANPAGNTTLRIDNIALSGSMSSSGYSKSDSSDYIAWGADQSWTFGSPKTGGLKDYDNDGLTNQQERVFGLDPTDALSKNLYVSAFNVADGTFSYTRRAQKLTGLTYVVCYSTDNKEWFRDEGATQTLGGANNSIETVDVQISPGVLAEPNLYIRMSVETP